MLLAALCAAGGCGGSASSARAQREARQQERAQLARSEARAAASAAGDDMVAAVGTSDSQTPVSLRFKLSERPQVGQTLHLQLALAQAPNVDIDAIHISLQPREGLLLQSEHNIEVLAPDSGATQQLDVQAVPQQAGVLGLSVTVLVDTSSSSIARNYAIPLIAVEAAQ